MIDGDWVESKDQDPEGNVRLVQLADIGVGRFLDKSSRYMTSEKALKLRCTFLEEGDILVARMPDPLGRACQFPGDDRKCVTVVDVCIIRPAESIANTSYVTHMLNSEGVRKQLDRFIKGTTRQRISRTNLEQIRIPLPPLPEQRRIAAILDQADALRAKRREALAELDTLETSCFESFLRRIQSAGLPLVPLGDAVETLTVGHVGPTSEYFCEQGIPFLRTGNVGKRNIDVRDIKHIVPEFHKKLKKSALKTGDVLVSRVISDEVRCAVVPPALNDANCANVIVIRPGDRISSEYLSFLIRSPDSQKAFLQRQVGSAQSVVNTKVLQEWPIAVPSRDMQHEFERQVVEIDALRQIQSQAMDEVSALFASLQHRAFRGEL